MSCLNRHDFFAQITTLNATPPSLSPEGNKERSSTAKVESFALLHAQEGTLLIVIVVKGLAFVGERRDDMYYRNDPSEYSLNPTIPLSGLQTLAITILVVRELLHKCMLLYTLDIHINTS